LQVLYERPFLHFKEPRILQDLIIQDLLHFAKVLEHLVFA